MRVAASQRNRTASKGSPALGWRARLQRKEAPGQEDPRALLRDPEGDALKQSQTQPRFSGHFQAVPGNGRGASNIPEKPTSSTLNGKSLAKLALNPMFQAGSTLKWCEPRGRMSCKFKGVSGNCRGGCTILLLKSLPGIRRAL